MTADPADQHAAVDPPDGPTPVPPRPEDGQAPPGVDDPSRQSTARGALIAVLVAVVVLITFEGTAVRRAGERLEQGWQRTTVLAVGKPAGAIADALPFSGIGDRFNAVVGGSGADPDTVAAVPSTAGAAESITSDAFPAAELGGRPAATRPLRKLLVTGDSMSTPMDAEIARALAGSGVETVREPRIGTSISQPEILDWPREAAVQAATKPDATVMFLGANEGFPLDVGGKNVECCTADWAAAYARAVASMMTSYRQSGDVRTYWMLLPLPRDRERREVAVAVNAAVRVAAGLRRAQVRLVDLAAIFTPSGRYRDAMEVDGREQLVRESDGIHLNDTGSRIAAEAVIARIREDYRVGPER